MSDTNDRRVMYQFAAFVFYTVVFWHKLSQVKDECSLHNSIFLALFVPKIIKFGGSLTRL